MTKKEFLQFGDEYRGKSSKLALIKLAHSCVHPKFSIWSKGIDNSSYIGLKELLKFINDNNVMENKNNLILLWNYIRGNKGK